MEKGNTRVRVIGKADIKGSSQKETGNNKGIDKIAPVPYDVESASMIYEVNTWGFRAIDVISKSVAKGIRFTYNGEGDPPEAERDLLNQIFYRGFPTVDRNKYKPIGELIQAIATDLEATGNIYIEVVRNLKGEVRALYYARAKKFRVKKDRTGYVELEDGSNVKGEYNNYTPYKEQRTEAKGYNPDLNEILHIKYENPNNSYYGISKAHILGTTYLGDQYSRKYNIAFFENNSIQPYSIIVEGGELSDDAYDRIVDSVQRKGVEHFHEVPVIEASKEGAKVRIEKLGSDRNDMNFLEFRKFNRDEIIGVYGVPPSKISTYENANYSNSKEQDKTFKEETIKPIQDLIGYRFDILIQEDLGLNNWTIEFEDLDKVEEKEQAEIDKIYLDRGVYVPNEIRKRRGIEPVEWGDEPINKPDPVQELADQISSNKADESLIRKIFKGSNKKVKKKETSILSKILKRLFSKGSEEDDLILEALEIEVSYQRRLKEALFSSYIETISELVGQGVRVTPQNIKEIMSDESFREVMLEFLTESVKTGGEYALAEVGVNISFNLLDERVSRYLEEFSFYASEKTMSRLRADVNTVFRESYEAGDPIDVLADKLQNGVFVDLEDYEAERIARTTIIPACNKGRLEGYSQSGVVIGKEWVTSGDDRVRDSHKELSGERVPIDEPFSNGMMYPNDYNERCTMYPILEGEEI